MAENTKIEWTNHTFNSWIGCQKVSPGCDNCLAPDTKVLYRDRTWRPLADVSVGTSYWASRNQGERRCSGSRHRRSRRSGQYANAPSKSGPGPHHRRLLRPPIRRPKADKEWQWREPRNFSLLTTHLRALTQAGDPAEAEQIIALSDVGETDLIDMQTSTGTFFANGFAVHNCYAETLSNRRGWTQWGPEGERVRTSPAYWRQPRAWDRKAQAAGERHRVFCASLADVFDNPGPPLGPGKTSSS